MGGCQGNEDRAVGERSSNYTSVPDQIVRLQTITWSKDSYGLFDYEQQVPSYQIIKLRGMKYYFLRDPVSGIISTSKNLTEVNRDKAIMCLEYNRGSYSLYPVNSSPLEQSPGNEKKMLSHNSTLWVSLRDINPAGNKQDRYKLKKGDYMRFGKAQYLIREVHNGQPVSSFPAVAREEPKLIAKEDVKISSNSEFMTRKTTEPQTSEFCHPQCRICLNDCYEESNPMISPCKCRGSMKYVHMNCLSHWLQSKGQVHVTGVVATVFWKTIECELCKYQLPESIDSEGVNCSFVTYPTPREGPYVVLEQIGREHNCQKKIIQVIDFSKTKTLTVGRGSECDIRIKDVSVSRLHAALQYEDGSFYLEDNFSKFGTLILAQEPIKLKKSTHPFTVQVGRTAFTINLEFEKKIGVMSSCLNPREIMIEETETLTHPIAPPKKRITRRAQSFIGITGPTDISLLDNVGQIYSPLVLDVESFVSQNNDPAPNPPAQ